MKKLIAGLVIAAGLAAPAWAEDAAGKWTGDIKAGGSNLPLVLTLTRGADGILAGYLESPNQTDQHIPIEAVDSDGKALSFTALAVLGAYKATWDEAKKSWSGTWSQGGSELPLMMTRSK